MYRNLDSETSKKLDIALANKIKVKRFVTRQEADAIKAALGKKDEIRKRTSEKDRTSSILKRLDRVDIGKLIKHPGHEDQSVHSPTGQGAKEREKKPKSIGRKIGETARTMGRALMGASDRFRRAKPGTYGSTVHQAAKRMVDMEEAGKEGFLARDKAYRKEKRAIFDGMSGRVYMGDIGGDFQVAIRGERYRREDERKKRKKR